MRGVIKKLLYTISIVLWCAGSYAQSLDQAKKLYNEGRYEEAKPAFERLVSRAPGNSSYNHWYGVCCFETGDLENAEKHLLLAVQKRVQESFWYMGELYMLTYRFEEAVRMYGEYIAALEKKKQDTTLFEARMDLAKRGQRMLERVENVQVIDSVVVDKSQFLSAYSLSEESGSLVSYRDFFNTREPVSSTVYMNQKENKIYYAKKEGSGPYALYTQSKLLDSWTDEKRLPAIINSGEQNSNYPYVLSDGATIYYASNGNGSLGGYDIFVTRYNTTSDSYLTPEQVGMPFNSLYDDYMLVIDEEKELGWFASNRYQPEGKVCLYLFIPDAARTRVESDSIELKRARAALFSIRDTWIPNANYTKLIDLAYTKTTGLVKPQKDFNFVINDKIVYYTLAEIRSPEAKDCYAKVIALNRQIRDLQQQLEQLRLAYTGSRGSREQTGTKIRQSEKQLETLITQPEEWEKKARNAEILYLRNHK